jgi:hypothetical protein
MSRVRPIVLLLLVVAAPAEATKHAAKHHEHHKHHKTTKETPDEAAKNTPEETSPAPAAKQSAVREDDVKARPSASDEEASTSSGVGLRVDVTSETPPTVSTPKTVGSPARVRRNRPPLLDLSLGAAGMYRSITYADDLFGAMTGFSVPFAPTLQIRAELFPGARATRSALSWFGLLASFEYAFLAPTPDESGARHATNAFAAELQPRLRVPLSRLELTVGAGAELRTFVVAGVASASAHDWSVLPTLAVRWQIIPPIAVRAEASYLYVLNAGELSTLFPHLLCQGIDVQGGVDLHIAWKLGARLGLQYRRYFFDARSVPGDTRIVGGGLDQSLIASFKLAIRI